MMKFEVIGVNEYSSTDFNKFTPCYTSWLSEQLCYYVNSVIKIEACCSQNSGEATNPWECHSCSHISRTAI